MQSQEQMQPPPLPLNMDKFLPQLNQTLANMKRLNAQQLGVLVQSQSETIGKQHDLLIQEISPLIQEVGRLLNEVEMLKKQIPKPPKELPKEGTNPQGDVSMKESMTQGDPPKVEPPK